MKMPDKDKLKQIFPNRKESTVPWAKKGKKKKKKRGSERSERASSLPYEVEGEEE